LKFFIAGGSGGIGGALVARLARRVDVEQIIATDPKAIC
jgi:nucleoside-diphosphate-sugar epimerase